MAVTTASGRWVKVAQPSPDSPGSLVATVTTTSRMPSGAVQIVRTSAIRGAVVPPAGSHAGMTEAGAGGAVDSDTLTPRVGDHAVETGRLGTTAGRHDALSQAGAGVAAGRVASNGQRTPAPIV